MISKNFFRVKHGPLFVPAIFAVIVLLSCPALSDTGGGPSRGPAAQTEKALRAGPAKAVSEQWKSRIWEIFPSEQVVGPPRPDPLREGYYRNGWKPFFIDSHFEMNEAGTLVMGRLGSLRDEAIDPGPYKLDELQNALEKLNRRRAALTAANLAPSETAADAPLAQPVPAPPAPPAHDAGVAGSAAAASPLSGQIQALHPERLRLYGDVFQAAAEFDIALAAAFSRYAREMNPFSAEEQARALSGQTPMAAILKDLEPSSPHYRTLANSYARYRELAANVIQQPFSASSTLRPGESGNRVRDLQKRLRQEGFYSGQGTGTYDHETQRAVKEFQAVHLIDHDGAVGQRTREWLNVPFAEKAEMIANAMRSLRQSPARKYTRFIRINIPQFLLEYHKDGKIEATHRVVVGKATGKKVKFRGRMVGENQTPTLASTIEQVILNPRWYVSDRIRLELNSEAKSDPEWFVRHGYVQMSSVYPWGQPRIFQQPGPNNALGRVKFEFPNVYAVYLHDTPKKSLFGRARRDFSHGCIRVDKALKLAETLLNDDKNPYAQKIESILGHHNQTFVRLAQPLPILIEYIPATSDGNGQVLFLGDPYGILKEDGNRKT